MDSHSPTTPSPPESARKPSWEGPLPPPAARKPTRFWLSMPSIALLVAAFIANGFGIHFAAAPDSTPSDTLIGLAFIAVALAAFVKAIRIDIRAPVFRTARISGLVGMCVAVMVLLSGCTGPVNEGARGKEDDGLIVDAQPNDARMVELLHVLRTEALALDATVKEKEKERMTAKVAAARIQDQLESVIEPGWKEIQELDPSIEWIPAYNAALDTWSRWKGIFTELATCTRTGDTCQLDWERGLETWDEAAFKANHRLADPAFTQPMGKPDFCGSGARFRCTFAAVQNIGNGTVGMAITKSYGDSPFRSQGAWAVSVGNAPRPPAGAKIDCSLYETVALKIYVEEDDTSHVSMSGPGTTFEVPCIPRHSHHMYVAVWNADRTVTLEEIPRACGFFGSYEDCEQD